MIEINNEKLCENCYYFRRHYVKGETRFTEINCGHCIKNSFEKLKPCGHWQPQEKRKDEIKEKQKETFAFLLGRLNKIAEVLEEE